MRSFAVAAVIPLFFLGSGCGHNIGDSCSTNVDCQPDGTRFCDTSAPGGYCTIDGCDDGTCPDEAVCIRFLSPVFNEPCQYIDTQPNTQANCPHVDDRCVCDLSVQVKGLPVCQSEGTDASGNPFNGHCAPESTEHRWCQLKCSSNGDCRSNYECRSTGTLGAEPVPTLTKPMGSAVKFCAPKAPPPAADLGHPDAGS